MLQNALLSSFVFQLCLAALASAAPVADIDGTLTTTASDAWSYGTGGGILGFIVLVLDILVFIEVLKSNRPPAHKALWCLVVFFFPIIGMIIYWLFSNRAAHNSSASYEPLA